mgnify:FL=1
MRWRVSATLSFVRPIVSNAEEIKPLSVTPLEEHPGYELKKLSPRHRDVASLLAQGVQRQVIAAAVNVTPEYVTWLSRQPLMIQYVKEMSVAVGLRLEAMFSQSVEVIADTMQNGTEDGRLKAAKLQLEATGRVGRFQVEPHGGSGGGDRLEQLAERLVGFLHAKRSKTYEGETVQDAQILNLVRKGEGATEVP